MDVGKDIMRVSTAMTSGIIAAYALSSIVCTPASQHLFASFSSLAAWGLITVLWYCDRHGLKAAYSLISWLPCFFMMGFTCFMTERLCMGLSHRSISEACLFPSFGAFSPLEDASAMLTRTIDSIPFADKENNALVRALILGDRSALAKESVNAFRDAGAAHLLALSGMHLGFIYILINRILCIFGNSIAMRKIRSAAVIIITLCYTVMCGSGPSLMRAWFFILLREGGRILDRPQHSVHILFASLTLQLIITPAAISSLGFQLSYGALAGIVFLWPQMRQWYDSDGIGKRIWDISSLSICAQACTAPLTLWHFGTFPKYFLITNLVSAPLIVTVMLCCIISTATAASAVDTAVIYAVLEFPLDIFRKVLSLIASLP